MKRSTLRVFALLLLALATTNVLTACNTVAGAGKDIEGAGDKIEDTAEDANDGDTRS